MQAFPQHSFLFCHASHTSFLLLLEIRLPETLIVCSSVHRWFCCSTPIYPCGLLATDDDSNPPSTSNVCPRMKSASSEHRNAVTAATSSGRPMRPAGV